MQQPKSTMPRLIGALWSYDLINWHPVVERRGFGACERATFVKMGQNGVFTSELPTPDGVVVGVHPMIVLWGEEMFALKEAVRSCDLARVEDELRAFAAGRHHLSDQRKIR